MTSQRSVLESFVPNQLLRWLAKQEAPLSTATSKLQEMVVWFADLHDFTRTTHEITETERAGPEVVTELLDRTFAPIIETVTTYGGEVLEFAGDSVIATWAIPDGAEPQEMLLRAGHCAREVLSQDESSIDQGRSAFRLRIGIGVGRGVLMQLGGIDDQWHFVIGGSPFDQIGVASDAALPGQIVLSREATEVIGEAARGEMDKRGQLRVAHFDNVGPLPDDVTEVKSGDTEDVLRFVPQPVVDRLNAGQGEWLGEFRRVSSVFVNLPQLDTLNPHDRDTLQDVVTTAQRALTKYQGTLMRILADDKGITLIAAFGLPPYAHEEDPYLSIKASKEIQTTLQAMRLEHGIGITTGRAFCGAYGSPVRRNYTTIGREVNLAARLMRAASFEILCDETTAREARRIEFNSLGERHLRGWDQPVQVFNPLWEKAGSEVDRPTETSLVGREAELNQLVAWLGALDLARSSAVVVVEGEAGIGKSALASDLIHTARTFDVKILRGQALPVAQPPYQAWRDVIEEIMGLTGVRSLARRQEKVRRQLAEWPQFAEWEALLNSVLDLQFPETATTRGMSGVNRRESTVELLLTLLDRAAEESPLMIVLDDLHWFDSASWAVTIGVARKVSSLLMLLLTRPMPGSHEQMNELTAVGTSAHLVLNPIDEQHALELARERLGAVDLEADLARMIVEAAEGIPLYIEELLFSLQEADALEIEDGVARLTRSVSEVGVPHTLMSVVLGRIDQLPPQLQITLKVASVIGRSFDTRVLEAVHPSHPDTGELESELAELSRLELIIESSPGSFDFKHALIRDAAYELLLFDQRKRIHRSVGTFIETLADEPQERLYSLLAHHWEQAEDHQKALRYSEKAGASALRKGANRETIEAYMKCLDLIDRFPEEFGAVSAPRRSQWHVEIAQAYEAMGNIDEAKAHFVRALELVGERLSANRLGKIGRLTWEAVKQALHIALPASIRVPKDEEEQVRLSQAAHVAALLGEIYYFQADLLTFPVLNLLAINLGERSGEPLVAGLAYSSTGYIVGTLRLRRLAERYFRLAREAEKLETDPGGAYAGHLEELQEMGPSHLIAVELVESVLALTFFEWDRARKIVTKGLERCNRLGDKYSAGIALAIRGFGSYASGSLNRALIDYERLLISAKARTNLEHEGWARSFAIPVLLAFNRDDEAREMATAATAILDEVDALTVPVIHGTRSQVEMRYGHKDQALASAVLALDAIDSTPFFIFRAAFASILETLVGLWEAESDPSSPQARKLAKLTRKALRTLRSFALVLPFARPLHRLFKGRVLLLQGHISRAQRNLHRGLTLAERCGFAWDAGLLHFELARSSPHGSEERRSHSAEALALFEQVGSVYDAERVRALDD